MTSSINLSTLVPGSIDTTTLISSLMSVAAQPQNQLKTQLTGEQTNVAAYTAINQQLAAVQTAAAALTSAWSSATATSSDASVVASAGPGTQSGTSTTFSVQQIASGQVTTVAAGSSTTVIADPSAGIDVVDSSGTSHHITLGSGTDGDVASAVNAAGLGVRASVISTDAGDVLQFSSTSTGSAAAFSISGLSASAQTLTAAQNAKITVGDPNAGGYSVSSPTNTFTGAIPGITFTVSQPATNVTISTSADQSGISAAVQNMVTAANTAIIEISQATGKGAILAGDPTLEAVQQSLMSAISAGAAPTTANPAGTSYESYGVDLSSAGAVTFDAAGFASAYGTDPSTTQTVLTTLATAFSAIGTDASDPSTGTISALVTAGNSKATDLTTQIATWDTRLADQQSLLQAKYSAMQAALASLKSESTYLTSMFASLTASSSSSSSSG